jgi:N4-gp56 family major capsid protein
MTDITVHANNDVDQWCKDLQVEYVRAMQLRKLMGKSENMPIQVKRELATLPGRDIYITLIKRLTGNGVTGDNTLMGNEENLGNYAHKITVDQIRHGVRRGRFEQKKTHFDLLKSGRTALKMWAMAKLRDDIIAALYSANVDGSTPYASCTEAEKDAWVDANSDRVQFGKLRSNLSTSAPAGGATYDHSDSLASNVDTTNDKLTYALVSLAARLAESADPHIRPINVSEKGEYYVMLAGSRPFRDLKNNMATLHQYAEVRGSGNPIWADGDILYENVLIKKIPEIGVVTGVGAGSIDCACNFLMGAQAVGMAIGEDLHSISHTDDYGNLKGAGVAEIRGIDKMTQNDVDHGLVSVWTAAVADS